jgi:hypothetical protein
LDIADAAVMGLNRECARRMSADSAPARMAGSIVVGYAWLLAGE